ncbi:oligopeptide ABC transporter substrate-binding protein [Metabacillus arenae]|uniref:Oligopeptide ABC transporter substrate-binding protein n=1 Tax=Metabacillus arenae TaxID=2771434 RepID=A0A926RZP9_9BACI|nr:oligopeptide ABC transporter substrate-binding protein [Metabacillus arenae]MBD1383045.1 oligopeptide ABC transporter substrate-binding protein [Metabacillus arenae]
MKKTSLWAIALLLVMSMFLAACSGGQTTSNEGEGGEKEGTSGETGEAKEGGIVTFAVDTAPEGIFEGAFSGSAVDGNIQEFMTEGVYKVNDELKYVPNFAEWEISEDNLTYTFKFKEGIKWHNGEELTVEDWKFALEVLADPDYNGPRYNYVSGVKGAKEYKEGKADSISGIEVVDPYTIKITFAEKKVNNLESLWSTPMPKKEYEGIAIKDLAESDPVRKNPVGLGPFKVKKVQSGEYVELERFDDYWQGKPKLDGVIVKVIDPSLTAGAFEKGEIDLMGIRPADLKQIGNLDNVTIEETNGVAYSYIGLRFGTRDKATAKSVQDNPKFESKELRQALLYAIDRPALIKAFLAGKAKVANTVIPTAFWATAPESELNEYKYDPKKAKELLAEAGYKDTNGDGFVEDPDGKEFKISFGHYAGPSEFEGRAKAIIQSWNDIGVKTELATGQLIEFNLYNEMKDNDDKSLDAFFGSWFTGADPDPEALWGSHAEWNYGRYVDEENDKLIKATASDAAFDEEVRKQGFIDWQKYFNENLLALPLWENMDLYAVNKRLQGVHVNALTPLNDSYKWYVTE